ncbi:MAG: hypothetical protein ABSH34_33410 [Verrucomicrobiota bacterium]|jgi:hypothetical protein
MPDFDSAVALSLSGPEPLAALLATGELPAGLWRQEEMAAIFRHQMAAPLAVDLGGLAPPAARRLEALAAAQGAPAQSFADLLRHQSPPLELLEMVKDFAKTNADHPENGLPKEIAAVLYYACIAAALLRLKARISKLSDADLGRGLRWAAEQPWPDEETKQLLARALAGIMPAGAREASGS